MRRIVIAGRLFSGGGGSIIFGELGLSFGSVAFRDSFRGSIPFHGSLAFGSGNCFSSRRSLSGRGGKDRIWREWVGVREQKLGRGVHVIARADERPFSGRTREAHVRQLADAILVGGCDRRNTRNANTTTA